MERKRCLFANLTGLVWTYYALFLRYVLKSFHCRKQETEIEKGAHMRGCKRDKVANC